MLKVLNKSLAIQIPRGVFDFSSIVQTQINIPLLELHQTMQGLQETLLDSVLPMKALQVPRELIDFSSIFNQINIPLLELHETMQGLRETIFDSVSSMTSIVNAALDSMNAVFDSPAFDLLKERMKLDEETVRAFQTAGWPIAPSMPMSLRQRVIELHKNGKAKFASQVILGYYHRKAFQNLKGMVISWQSDTLFAPRMHIFNDALDAHMKGQYTLSVPALMPQIEGILSELVNEYKLNARLGSIQQVYKAAIGDPDEMGLDTWAIAKGLLFLLENNMYINTAFGDEMTKPLRQRKISRHTVLHGINHRYDKATVSLNTFLILDAIFALMAFDVD